MCVCVCVSGCCVCGVFERMMYLFEYRAKLILYPYFSFTLFFPPSFLLAIVEATLISFV